MKHDYKKTTHLSAWLTAFMCVLLFTSSGVVAQVFDFDSRERISIGNEGDFEVSQFEQEILDFFSRENMEVLNHFDLDELVVIKRYINNERIERNEINMEIISRYDQLFIFKPEFEAIANINTLSTLLTEDFTSTTFPPTGWSRFDLDGGGSQWIRLTTSFNSAPASAFHQWSTAVPAPGQNGWLVSPAIEITSADFVLSFAERTQFPGDYKFQGVFISTNSCNPADGDFVQLVEVNDGSNNWRTVTYDLDAYNGETICIGFNYGGFDGSSWYIDDVIVFAPNPQPNPAILVSPANAATNVSRTPTLTWSAGTGTAPDEYEVYFGTSPTPSLVATVPASETSWSTPTLNYETTYYWNIVAKNAAGTADPSPTRSFTTMADPTLTVPFFTNFNDVAVGTIPTGWSRESFSARPWQATDGANFRFSGNRGMATFFNGTAAKNEWLFTPPFALEEGVTYNFSFYVRAPGWAGVAERFRVYVGETASPAAMLENPHIYQSEVLIPSFTQVVLSFTAPADGAYHFAWHQYSAANLDYLAIDNVNLEVAPADPVFAVSSLMPYTQIPLSLFSTEFPISASVFNSGAATTDVFDVNFSETETAYAATGSTTTPFASGSSQTVSATPSFSTVGVTPGTYTVDISLDSTFGDPEDLSTELDLNFTNVIYARDTGTYAATGVGSNTAAILFGTIFDIPEETSFSSIQAAWPVTIAAAAATFNFSVYKLDGETLNVESTILTTQTFTRSPDFAGNTLNFVFTPVTLEAGRYMVAMRQLTATNIGIAYDQQPSGIFYTGNNATTPTFFNANPGTAFGNLAIRMDMTLRYVASVTVLDESDDEIEGATVTVFNDADEQVATGSTNASGVFSAVLAPGSYTFTASAVGFTTSEGNALDVVDGNVNVPVNLASSNPTLAVSPLTRDFGTVTVGNTSGSQVFTISNVGGGSLTISPADISLVGAAAAVFNLTNIADPVSLATGESTTVSVSFSPVAGGAVEAELEISSAEATNGSVSATLSGTGFDATIRSPFVENFDTVTPANWEQRFGILSEETEFGALSGSAWIRENFMNNVVNGFAARLNLWVSTSSPAPVHRWLITPSINLDDLGSATTLKFDLGIALWGSPFNPSQLSPESYFAVVISTDNGATWSSDNVIFSKSGADGDLIAPGGETFYVDLSAYTGTVRIGFYGSRTSGTVPDLRFYLANVGIHETVSQSRSAAGWNVMSMPANNIRVRELAAQNLVQGVPGANGFYGTDGVNYEAFASNLYFYGNVAAGGGVPDGDGSPESWVRPTNFSTRIASGQGFIWYFFDTPNTGIPTTPLPFNLNAIGLEPTTDVVRALNTATTHSLLGNPFNYTIPAGNVTGPIQGSVQVWDGDSFVPATNIPAFTGFFAEKNADGDVTIAADPGMTSADSDQSIIVFHLDGVAQDGAAVRDHATRIVFRDQATQGWDIHDLTKLYSLNYPSVALSVIGEREGNQVNKVIDSRPAEISETIEIPLALDVFAFSGSFTLSAEMIDVPEAWTILLTDMETGISVDLRQQAYTFEYESASTASHPDFATTFGGTALQSEDTNGRFVVTIHPVTTDLEPGADLPTVFALNQNYPNPFNPTTQLSYDLPQSADVRLEVFNIQGQRVATLVNATQNAGRYNVTFDARNLASGVYIYRLQAGSHVMTKKMTLVK